MGHSFRAKLAAFDERVDDAAERHALFFVPFEDGLDELLV
jgi:hypothetical protein